MQVGKSSVDAGPERYGRAGKAGRMVLAADALGGRTVTVSADDRSIHVLR